MDDADPAFPRSTAYWWFGCKSANRGTLGNDHWPFAFANNLDVADIDTHDDYGSLDSVGDIILDAGTKSFESCLASKKFKDIYYSLQRSSENEYNIVS